jgi:hypothetical protein
MGVVAVGAGLGVLSGYAVGKSSNNTSRGATGGKKRTRDMLGTSARHYEYTIVNETDDVVSYMWYNEIDIERFGKQLGVRPPIELQPRERQTFVSLDSVVVVQVADLLTNQTHKWRLSGTKNNELVLSNDE